MKRAKRILIIVVIVLAGMLLALNYGLGAVVKSTVKIAGTPLLGVPVTLETAHLRLLQGVIRLKGLTVGNPDGCKTPHAIHVDEVAVDFDLKSLFTDTFVINRVFVKSPDIIYELGLGKSNIGRILEHLESGESSPEPETKSEGGKKVIIEDFLISDAHVRLSATVAMGSAVPIPLPEIHLKDIGKEEGSKGASPVEVIRKVFGAITGAVTHAVTGSVGLIGDGAKAVGSGAGKVAGSVKKLFTKDDPASETNTVDEAR
jgi:hypothetical protein